jgi:glutathione S-transferase
MPKLKLTYFDFHGARGETARLAMHIGQVPFEDHRVSSPEFQRIKPDLPFGSIPILEVDGRVLAQSNAINRYVGKLAGLYPEDPLQAAFCDETMDAVEDISVKISPTLFMKDEAEKRRAREELAEGAIPFYLARLAQRLESRGGTWFADGRLTVADLKVFVWVRHVASGKLDHVPADLPARVAPAVAAHLDRVRNHPPIAAYYAARGVT